MKKEMTPDKELNELIERIIGIADEPNSDYKSKMDEIRRLILAHHEKKRDEFTMGFHDYSLGGNCPKGFLENSLTEYKKHLIESV